MIEQEEIEISFTLTDKSQFLGFADCENKDGALPENIKICVGIGDFGFTIKGSNATLKSFANFILSTLEPI